MKYLCEVSIFCKPQSYNDVTKYYTLQITRESLKTAIVQKYSYVENWTKNLNSAHLHSSKNLIFKASSLFNPVGLAGYFEYSQKSTDIFWDSAQTFSNMPTKPSDLVIYNNWILQMTLTLVKTQYYSRHPRCVKTKFKLKLKREIRKQSWTWMIKKISLTETLC